MQLAYRAQQGAVEARPAHGLRPVGHPHNLFIAEADPPGGAAVLAPFVLRAAQVTDAEDQQLAITRRQGALAKDVAGEASPRVGERGMVGKRLRDVEPIRRLEGRNARFCRLRLLRVQGRSGNDQAQNRYERKQAIQRTT